MIPGNPGQNVGNAASIIPLLRQKHAVIYGGGGAIGGAVARAFAREGAKVYLAGRTLATLQRVAADIEGFGGAAEIARVDALDPAAVSEHVDRIAAKAGSVDIALNAVGIVHVQGTPLSELSPDEFLFPIDAYARANFNIAQAVARPMTRQRSGVILTLSTPGSRMTGTGFLGYGVTCGAIETFSRILAGELGSHGVRVICLRPDAIPEALSTSHAASVFEGFATRAGVSVEAMLDQRARTGALLGRFPTLAEVADFAAFVASDRAGATTGAIVNLTCGSLVD